MFLTESWFWRGTQSAVFYYVSCSPCLDASYRRQRRKEAARSEKAKPDIVSTQPGVVQQPGAFETNEAWVEELVAGPGPPKGWKADEILQRRREGKLHQKTKVAQENNAFPMFQLDATRHNPALQNDEPESLESTANPSSYLHEPAVPDDNISGSSSESAEAEVVKPKMSSGRPRVDRRMSSTIYNIRDTLRSSLHPESWNWIRYDREDEVLRGFNERINRMWDRATGHGSVAKPSSEESMSQSGRKRAATNESERYDYYRARNPAVNDLHPPVVSQLPVTRDEVAWMLLPPPRAAVMEGKVKPEVDLKMRWPLAKIGTTKDEMLDQDAKMRRRKATPPLSYNAASEDSSMEDTPPSPGQLRDQVGRASRPTSLPLEFELIPTKPSQISVPTSPGSWDLGLGGLRLTL